MNSEMSVTGITRKTATVTADTPTESPVATAPLSRRPPMSRRPTA